MFEGKKTGEHKKKKKIRIIIFNPPCQNTQLSEDSILKKKKIAMEEHSVSPTEMSFVWSVTADNMEDYGTNNSNCQNSYQHS